jgi:hypothetical protein
MKILWFCRGRYLIQLLCSVRTIWKLTIHWNNLIKWGREGEVRRKGREARSKWTKVKDAFKNPSSGGWIREQKPVPLESRRYVSVVHRHLLTVCNRLEIEYVSFQVKREKRRRREEMLSCSHFFTLCCGHAVNHSNNKKSQNYVKGSDVKFLSLPSTCSWDISNIRLPEPAAKYSINLLIK